MKSLSIQAAQRCVRREATALDSMIALLPGWQFARRSARTPRCVATMPILYCPIQELLTVVSGRAPRSASWMALFRWDSGLTGSAQMRWIDDSWHLASLSLGKPARALHALAQRIPMRPDAPRLWLLAVSPLRVQCAVIPRQRTEMGRLQIIQAGLSSVRAGARYRADSLHKKLLEDQGKFSDARTRATASQTSG
jgi:hypothetical protein